MAKKTSKNKATSTKRGATKKQAAGKQRKPSRRKGRPVGSVTTGALTPRASKGDAAVVPVSSFAELVGYWDVLLNSYCAVAIKAQSLDDGRLYFKILNPNTGVPFNNGEVFDVNLEDGETTYPGFPATGQLIDPESNLKYGYLLLAPDWLKNKLGSQSDDYAGPKRPMGASL